MFIRIYASLFLTNLQGFHCVEHMSEHFPAEGNNFSTVCNRKGTISCHYVKTFNEWRNNTGFSLPLARFKVGL